MFSGLSFLVDEKLCVSVASKNRVLLRLSPTDYDDAVEKNGVDTMDRNGKPMKGYIYLHEELVQTDKQLKHWVDKALAFNPLAQSSKK